MSYDAEEVWGSAGECVVCGVCDCGVVDLSAWDFHAGELDRLERLRNDAYEASTLTTERDVAGVDEFLIRLRLG